MHVQSTVCNKHFTEVQKHEARGKVKDQGEGRSVVWNSPVHCERMAFIYPSLRDRIPPLIEVQGFKYRRFSEYFLKEIEGSLMNVAAMLLKICVMSRPVAD